MSPFAVIFIKRHLNNKIDTFVKDFNYILQIKYSLTIKEINLLLIMFRVAQRIYFIYYFYHINTFMHIPHYSYLTFFFFTLSEK